MSWRTLSAACIVIIASLPSIGCQKKSTTEQAPSSETQAEQAAPAEPEADPAILAAATAKKTFNSKCIVCHLSLIHI